MFLGQQDSKNSFLAPVFLLLSLFIVIMANPSVVLAEITFSGYSGIAKTKSSDLTISQPGLGNNLTFFDVSYSNESFGGTAPYYGLRVGYFFESMPFLGIEIEFLHARVFAKTNKTIHVSGTRNGVPYDQMQPMNDIIQEFEIHHGMNYLFFNLAGRYGFFKGQNYPSGRLLMLGRLGIGPTIPRTDSEIGGQHLHGSEWDEIGLQLAFGPEIFIWKKIVSLFGEYKLIYNNISVAINQGTAETNLLTHHLVFGLNFHY